MREFDDRETYGTPSFIEHYLQNAIMCTRWCSMAMGCGSMVPEIVEIVEIIENSKNSSNLSSSHLRKEK